jgi:hypothetical protein
MKCYDRVCNGSQLGCYSDKMLLLVCVMIAYNLCNGSHLGCYSSEIFSAVSCKVYYRQFSYFRATPISVPHGKRVNNLQ